MTYVTVRPQTQLLNVVTAQELAQPNGKCDRCIDMIENALDMVALYPEHQSQTFKDLDQAVNQRAKETRCRGCGFMGLDLSQE